MDIQDRLIFCQRCEHKKFDPKRGIVCGLTNEKANFEDFCKDFVGNEKEVVKEIQDKKMRETQIEELLQKVEADDNGNPIWTIVKIIIAIIMAIVGFLAA